METVLYYEPVALYNRALITGVCEGLGLKVIPVSPAQMGERVGFLAGCPGVPSSPEGGSDLPPPERVLVFCGVDPAKLDDVLEALKAAGAPRSLKAVLTDTNTSWRFSRLAWELIGEQRFVDSW